MEPPAALTATARKRRRDISSLKVFKDHMYQQGGIASLHKLVEQNPILMNPPPGIEAAREHERLLQILQEHSDGSQARDSHAVSGRELDGAMPPALQRPERVDVDEFLRDLEKPADGGAAASPVDATARDEPAQDALHSLMSTGQPELATYHRKQLASLIALYYEFNHTEFVKLPIKQTTDLLLRCGREAFAHLHEFEQTERARKRRIREQSRDHAEQHVTLSLQKQVGRDEYFDHQLAAAERRHEQLISGTGFDDDVEDYDRQEYDALLTHQNDQTLYTMFPLGHDDDEDEGVAASGVVDMSSVILSTAELVDAPALIQDGETFVADATLQVASSNAAAAEGSSTLLVNVSEH